MKNTIPNEINQPVNNGPFVNVPPQPVRNKQRRKLIVIVLLIIVLLLCGGIFGIYKSINDFDSCEKAGFPVRLLDCAGCPKFCDTPWGVTFSKSQSISSTTVQPSIKPTPINNIPLDWKTYTNTKLNYQLQYPSEWKIVDSPEPLPSELHLVSNIDSFYSDSPQANQPRYVKYSLNIIPFGKDNLTVLNSILKSNLIIVGGKKTYQTTQFPDGTYNYLNTFIDFSEDNYLKIELWPYFSHKTDDPQQLSVKIIYDQILTTFKFIE